MGNQTGNETRLQNPEEAATVLFNVIQELIAEVHPQQLPAQTINMDSTLDRDLGLDSLARVELLARIERQFYVTLPDRIFAEAETPRDLLRALLSASSPKVIETVTQISRAALGEEEVVPHTAKTLIEVLDWHVLTHPDRPHIQIYSDDETEDIITYRDLIQGAEKVMAGLQQRGVVPGEAVAIMLPAGREYFFSFFGILLAGAIPVPIYPPMRLSRLEDHMRRHKNILTNCMAPILITVPEARKVAGLLKSLVDTLRSVITVEELYYSSNSYQRPAIGAYDTAFLQYTSGSTGNPKGVVLTHANLLANIRAMGERVQANANDVFVSWLPLYHDMGLIGAWLGSLYYSALLVIMSPLAFLTRPQRWLWAIHRHRGTLSASPNFGYELCLHRLDDKDLKGLDLSSWRLAFNGAEQVIPETVQHFCQRFSQYGFRRQAFMPVYGLAENSVGLTFPPIDRGPLIDRIQRESFTRTGHAIPAETEKTDSNALCFVSSGTPLLNHQMRIVDLTNQELPDRQEGRLQFCGPSATSGYFRNPEETRRLFNGKWLDSGDLAYIADGELYLTGRSKDIIIRAGRNLYPHELEEAIGEIDGIRKGRVAVFGSNDPVSGTERLIVLAETREAETSALEHLRSQINAIATDLVNAPPDEVVLAPPDTVLKTSSGKIRRAASRELYEKGLVGKPQKAVWQQVMHLILAGMVPQLRRTRRVLLTGFYGLYARLIFWILAPLTWLLVIALPRLSWRWSVMRHTTNLLARATGTPYSVQGIEHLPSPNQPCIYVANHASYLDGPFLIMTLARQFSFVAKKAFVGTLISGSFLQRINAEFVERLDIQEGVSDVQRLVSVAQTGRPLMFFPEGTFTRVPGLLPFHMGAFMIAAEARIPIVPIAIRGSRSIFRAESWLPHHGAITVTIGTPIEPADITIPDKSDTWNIAVAMRDAARKQILSGCGEPDLAEEKFPITIT